MLPAQDKGVRGVQDVLLFVVQANQNIEAQQAAAGPLAFSGSSSSHFNWGDLQLSHLDLYHMS